MRKIKILLGALTIGLFLTASVVNLYADESLEPGGGSYKICYFNSKVRTGFTYYDCGSCTKVYDEQGKGSYSKCWI
jgi:hypothetical protein